MTISNMQNNYISTKAKIDATAEIGSGVTIEDNVTIGPKVRIFANAYICNGTEIGEGTEIHMGAVVGNIPQDLAYKGGESFTKIGKNNIIREYVTIHRGTTENSTTVIGDNNYLMVQSHVGHNCIIENNVIIANGALLAGHVHVENGAFLSGNVVFHQFCRIGTLAMIGGFSGVNKDVPPYVIVRGPSSVRGLNLLGLRRAGFKADMVRQVKEAYKIFYLSGLSTIDALQKISDNFTLDEIKHFVSFIRSSKRGVCKVRFQKDEFFQQENNKI